MTSDPFPHFDPELLARLLSLGEKAADRMPEPDARKAFAAQQANMDAAVQALRAASEMGLAGFAQMLGAAEAALSQQSDPDRDPMGVVTELADQLQAGNDAAWRQALDAISRLSPENTEPRQKPEPE